jgi:hemerythrin-like domain-containing protein
MELIQAIVRDHRLIEGVAGSLAAWARRGADHPGAAADLADIVRFLEIFVHEHHHRREEVLFQALVEHAEVPGHRGPIAILTREHRTSKTRIDELASTQPSAVSADAVEALASELLQHLDKEESVLLPEAERRLIDGGIRELDGGPVSDEVNAAVELGRAIIGRLPPIDPPDLIRGDGCIVCPAFGDRCSGIETEWWSDWEREHYAGLDEG